MNEHRCPRRGSARRTSRCLSWALLALPFGGLGGSISIEFDLLVLLLPRSTQNLEMCCTSGRRNPLYPTLARPVCHTGADMHMCAHAHARTCTRTHTRSALGASAGQNLQPEFQSRQTSADLDWERSGCWVTPCILGRSSRGPHESILWGHRCWGCFRRPRISSVHSATWTSPHHPTSQLGPRAHTQATMRAPAHALRRPRGAGRRGQARRRLRIAGVLARSAAAAQGARRGSALEAL